MQASLLYKSENILAEGPLWHTKRKSFFWVDIDGKSFQEYNWQTKQVQQWKLDYRPSLLIEHADGNLIIGMQGGIAYFDLNSNAMRWLCKLEEDIPNNRTNDGGCDPMGRIWIGTMDRQFAKGKGSLYCIHHDMKPERKIENVSISNGLVWSLDEARMYFIDTPTQQVKGYLFNKETGDIQFEKIIIAIDKDKSGSPDGMCMDAEGMLWIAQWNGFGVYRYNPVTGECLDKIELPVPQVSSCAFGGGDNDYLFITTARENMDEEAIEKYPLSGNVFIVKMNVRGAVIHKFGEEFHAKSQRR
ncbi:MAG: SMP-30/gluconolactonase/LRE family protein [Chitinophagaceae bacterium]|nr:SMP-30/gluconolactonase/LRE family protein [Chitinophagaceae bacterium]